MQTWWQDQRGNTYVSFGTLVGVVVIVSITVYFIVTGRLEPWMSSQFHGIGHL